MLAQFYTAIIESILTSSILPSSVLTSSIMVLCWCHHQGQTKAAARHARCREGDGLQASIHPGPVYLQDPEACRSDHGRPSHPGHGLVSPLPSGRRLRSIRTKTSRYTNSFFPSAIRLLNTK
ncbi:hypothetical protein D4764_04G0015520 [Takifugu flavidus]|uniref:Uncharacterized protein n=1 Tax=Takifugu flavidus TaxID=433684 RepID=A0A5C6N729_9TELE|nr:hypothetical protein D4764_04G0015520 [Takifugu flavidus]